MFPQESGISLSLIQTNTGVCTPGNNTDHTDNINTNVDDSSEKPVKKKKQEVLRERVEKMQKEMKDLKKLIDLIYGKGIWDLDFKLKCADRKIITMEKMMFEDVECADTADLKTKATEVENKLRPLLQKLQEIGHGLGKTDDKLLHPLHNNQIEDEPKPEEEASESPAASNAMETVENWVDEDMHFPDDKKYKKDDEAQKWKAEDLATQEQFLKSYMKKKKGKDSLLLDVSDYTNGASSNNGKNIKDDKKELASEEKPFIKKLDDLMVQTEKLLWDVAKLRKDVDKFLSPGLLDAIEEGLNEVEANIDILSESYHLSDVRTRRPHISREKKLAELYKLYGDVKEKYNNLKCRVG
ncbi:uncharacterized protein [Magallana gigas]|uniref:uncharacterized protein isoform X2 n=1 Tax=Magallana gigas TaxID=29159 RepID=UPI003340D9AB